MKNYQTAGKTASQDSKTNAKLVRKAFQENRIISFRWYKDGCMFIYHAKDDNAAQNTALDIPNSINVLRELRFNVRNGGGLCVSK